jgi:hypothetical protein
MKTILMLQLFLTASVIARTQPGPEQTAIFQLCNVMQAHRTLHGTYPTNWQQVGKTDRINFRLSKYGIEPLQAIYVFVPQGLVLRGGDRILIIRVRPTVEGNEPGRHVVVEDTQHELSEAWIKEVEVQRLFDNEKISLRAPVDSDVKVALEGVKRISDENSERMRSVRRDYLWISALRRWGDFVAGISKVFWRFPKICIGAAFSCLILFGIVVVRHSHQNRNL